MEAGTFDFNGTNSLNYGIRVQHKPSRNPAAKNLYIGTPSNRNGSIIKDLGTFPNTSIELNCWVKTDTGLKNLDDITDWLSTSDYVEFTPWYDPEFTYKVILSDMPEFSYILNNNSYLTFTIKLAVYPIKYAKDTYKTAQAVSNNSILTNPFKYNAYPWMRVTSNNAGNVVINIGGISYTYKSFSGTLDIDSLIPAVSVPTLAIGLDFPYIKPGPNTVVLTNVTSLSLIPRYGRRAL